MLIHFIFAGNKIPVEIRASAYLRTARDRALFNIRTTFNQSFDNWDMYSMEGFQLCPGLRLGTQNIKNGARIYLYLRN